jgi:hypothetical protein
MYKVGEEAGPKRYTKPPNPAMKERGTTAYPQQQHIRFPLQHYGHLINLKAESCKSSLCPRL